MGTCKSLVAKILWNAIKSKKNGKYLFHYSDYTYSDNLLSMIYNETSDFTRLSLKILQSPRALLYAHLHRLTAHSL